MGKESAMIRDYLKKIKTSNINNDIERIMGYFFERVKQKKETLGIVKLGGLASRGFSDIFSDIDASIFVTEAASWLPQFEFYVPANRQKIPFYEINIHQNTFEREYQQEWEEAKKEAYEEGEIFFQKDFMVENLLKEKVIFSTKVAEIRKNILVDALNRFQPTGNAVNDHLAANKMLNQVVELLYLFNREFRPHKKWRFEKLRYASWLPKNIDALIREALLVKELNIADIKRRRNALRDILHFYGCEISDGFGNGKGVIEVGGKGEGSFSEFQQQQMMALISGQWYWYVDVNPLRQVERGFIFNSHDLLNESLVMILESLRITRNQNPRQFVEPLNVLNPYPEYDECQYNLWADFDTFRHLEQHFINALFVKEFSRTSVENRIVNIQQVTKTLLESFTREKWIKEDPYHFALANVYFDRQLLNRTFGEKICPMDLTEEEEMLFKGFVSYHLIGNRDQLAEAIKNANSEIYNLQQIQKIKDIALRVDDPKNF